MKIHKIVLLLLWCSKMISAQTVGTGKISETPAQQRDLKTRPTIMVFPYFKTGQNLKDLVENDANNRLVMTKVRELFDSRGYSTIDFLSKARNLITNESLNQDTQTDLKTMIVQSSGTDISVEVEYQYNESNTGNEVKLILTAYESASSTSLSNKVGFSGKFYSNDIGKLSNRAINSISEDFLNTIQSKFDDIVTNGRYLAVEFSLGEKASFSMETEVGENSDPLSDYVEEWIRTNTKSYHIQGVTNKKLIYDVIRIPRVDTNGNILTTSKYSSDLLKFCKSISITSSDTTKKIKVNRLVKGNTILITFLE